MLTLVIVFQQRSGEVKVLYESLMERIDNYEPEPLPEPEKVDMDTPLMSVPAPTPAHP